jgi:epoxyqueuosine reductase QueG
MDKKEIKDELSGFVLRYGSERSIETEWEKPLIGFASAGDPLFPELRRLVSPAHGLPGDLLTNARTVVAFFLPLGKSIGRSNIPGSLASREWALAYLETNMLISETGLHMKHYIESKGYDAISTPPTHNFDPLSLVSDWSHRHIAFIAGLGRFGLNNMLITGSGCCGRIGSFITSLELFPDQRPTEEACLYRHDGSCRLCTNRCVGDALFPDRFDRHKCYQRCLENEKEHQVLGHADVCGKCLVGVPCTFADPVEEMRKTGCHSSSR